MTVLVTGAAGYVGREVVAALVGSGRDVRALVHRSQGDPPEGVEHVHGDVTDAESLRAAAEGCEAIVHLVAILNGSSAPTRTSSVRSSISSLTSM